jgi:hypothetical protein
VPERLVLARLGRPALYRERISVPKGGDPGMAQFIDERLKRGGVSAAGELVLDGR